SYMLTYYCNDTSSTEIYTLSLHDALPILDKLISFLSSDSYNGSMTDSYIKSQIVHFYFVYIHPYYDVNGRTSRTLSMWYLFEKEDRKSTRLNSSHVKISYAVFCLKKKRKR